VPAEPRSIPILGFISGTVTRTHVLPNEAAGLPGVGIVLPNEPNRETTGIVPAPVFAKRTHRPARDHMPSARALCTKRTHRPIPRPRSSCPPLFYQTNSTTVPRASCPPPYYQTNSSTHPGRRASCSPSLRQTNPPPRLGDHVSSGCHRCTKRTQPRDRGHRARLRFAKRTHRHIRDRGRRA